MTLYWTAEETISIREAQMHFWLGALEEFDLDIIRDQCQAWANRPGSKRPMPGDIRALCIPEHNRRAAERALPPPGSRLSEEEAYARSVGWASAAERRDAIARSEAKLGQNVDTLQQGKEIGDRWAQKQGYPSLNAYALANGLDYVGARMKVIRSFLGTKAMPLEPGEAPMDPLEKERRRQENLQRQEARASRQKSFDAGLSVPERPVHDVLEEMGITSRAAD